MLIISDYLSELPLLWIPAGFANIDFFHMAPILRKKKRITECDIP